MIAQQALIRLGISFSILALGFLAAQLLTKVLLWTYRTRRKIVSLDADRKLKTAKYFIMTIAIVAALAYANADALKEITNATMDALPEIFTAILLLILGIIIANFATDILERAFSSVGIADYAGVYEKRQMFKLIFTATRILLYLLVIEFVMPLFGIRSSALSATIRIVVYGSFAILALLVFFGMRSIVENWVAGFYVRGSGSFKPGTRIVINGESGEISEISKIDTTIYTDSGYIMRIPNNEFLKKEVKFERIRSELKALSEIKSHFVAQKPSHCGPASAEMILSIFGHGDINQHMIAGLAGTEVGKGTHPDRLRQAVEELTEGRVLGHWISITKIIDLKQELKSWLNDGALMILDFKRAEVFPTSTSTKAHYAVCLGIEGEDLLILDPSLPKGGVYLAHYQDVQRGMNTYSELIKGKRGYLVLAPKGTPAYWRLRKGLVYADRDLYGKLGKGLEEKFESLIRKSAFIKNVLPESLRNYIREYEERYKIGRLWRPEKTT
ncbi:MAG: mechanosensitive ion channel domain-containing protein [Candidatus Woesearchaeota archaeon]